MVYIFNEYPSSRKNGVGTFIRELTKCLNDIDVCYCILSFNCPVKEIVIDRSGNYIKEILFPPFMTNDFMSYCDVFVKILRLHINDCSNNLFFINYTPCKKLVIELKEVYKKTKIVLLIHDLSWTSKLLGDIRLFKSIINNKVYIIDYDNFILKRFYSDIETLKLVDYVICLSKDTYNLMLDIYNVDKLKLFLIPNGLRKDSYTKEISKIQLREKYNISDFEILVLFVGRPTSQKGIYPLLQAMDKVLKKYPNSRLVIAGQNIYDENKKLFQLFPQIVTHVTFLGLLDTNALHEWYIMADIGVIPSFYEQCSYVGIEMMMYGLPIVVSDGLGLRNMFIENQTALFAHIDNRDDLSIFSNNLYNSICRLLSSEILREKLSINIKNHYEKYYNGELMKEKYNELLLSMLD